MCKYLDENANLLAAVMICLVFVGVVALCVWFGIKVLEAMP
jgi:hypothetical protein